MTTTPVITTWMTNDSHAGAIIGLLLGTVFLITGLCIALVMENGVPVPMWRKLTGVTVIGLGFFALVTGVIFASQD